MIQLWETEEVYDIPAKYDVWEGTNFKITQKQQERKKMVEESHAEKPQQNES